MKRTKILSIILVLTMILTAIAVSSCSDEGVAIDPAEQGTDTAEATTAPETTAADTEAETTAAETTAVETTAAVEDPVFTEAKSETGYYIESLEAWHYKTFYCPYTDGAGVLGGSAANGYFDEIDDEMAAFVTDNPEWYKDTDMMGGWDEVDAPFGDCIDKLLSAETDFVLDPNTNGLMVYKTFNIEELGDDIFVDLCCFYDNTCYLYINGELFFYADANCGSGDWNGGYDSISYNATDEEKTVKDFLKVGENYIAVSIKNCWGGREFDLTLEYEKNSSKATMEFFPIGSEWHYSVFSCPYTDGEGTVDGGVAGGYYDEATDEMAAFIAANPNFTTDTATLSAWPTASGPFGNIMEDIGWTGGVHGLICYKAFTVTDLAKVKTANFIKLNSVYDNAIHVYLNGTEIYVDDGECVVQDWNGGYTAYNLDTATISELLVEGENTLVVTIKDAWGGRNFDAGFSAEWE